MTGSWRETRPGAGRRESSGRLGRVCGILTDCTASPRVTRPEGAEDKAAGTWQPPPWSSARSPGARSPGRQASLSGAALLPPLGLPTPVTLPPNSLQCRSPSPSFPIGRSRTLAEFFLRLGGVNKSPNIEPLTLVRAGNSWFGVRRGGAGDRRGFPEDRGGSGKISRHPLDRGFCLQPNVDLPLLCVRSPTPLEFTLQL